MSHLHSHPSVFIIAAVALATVAALGYAVGVTEKRAANRKRRASEQEIARAAYQDGIDDGIRAATAASAEALARVAIELADVT